MSTVPTLRLWPGLLAAALLLLFRLAVPVLWPGLTPYALVAALVCALAVMVWWGVFSRAPRSERRGAVILMWVALVAVVPFSHVSMRAGFGLTVIMSALPVLSLAFVAWAVATQGLSHGFRRVSMVATILIAVGAWTLVRTNGTTSDVIGSDLRWRWTPTAEERLLADTSYSLTPAAPVAHPAEMPVAPAPAVGSVEASAPTVVESSEATVAADPAVTTRVLWPGFRGPQRDSIIRGVRIGTDWAKTPPVALWRRPIGPGWSSFAVAGDLLYTQEQRGDDEIVASYRVSTGEPVWSHRDSVRFWESNGGAGPRATPTISHGRVYTFGATGILNALDAGTGSVVWSANVPSDIQAEIPLWGFASSPVVVNNVVVVAAAGQLVGYDLTTGKRRWVGPAHGAGYSSPHLLTIGGVSQIVLTSDAGATSVAPADGTVLWEHEWNIWPLFPVVQPAVAADGELLIALGNTRRIAVQRNATGWTTEERWTSSGLKPNFNDFVVHNGHAFGFDGIILACIDLQDGKRKWKGGRYGQGQLVLLADQNLLLVVSDEGELALVGAGTDQYTEIARVPGIEGKTWNHPVLVGDVLLVRNGEEMAAFRLPLAGR